MRSLLLDLRRAICSWPFAIGVILQVMILKIANPYGDLYQASVPVLATLAYSTAWLQDYESGFLKSYLPRSGVASYILGKILACGISGGLLEVAGCYIYTKLENYQYMDLKLVFLSAVFWAMLAAVMAAGWKSRYVAYGGSFVVFYLLVMVQERYLVAKRHLNPLVWTSAAYFGELGEFGLYYVLGGGILLLVAGYYAILRRKIN